MSTLSGHGNNWKPFYRRTLRVGPTIYLWCVSKMGVPWWLSSRSSFTSTSAAAQAGISGRHSKIKGWRYWGGWGRGIIILWGSAYCFLWTRDETKGDRPGLHRDPSRLFFPPFDIFLTTCSKRPRGIILGDCGLWVGFCCGGGLCEGCADALIISWHLYGLAYGQQH